MTRAIQLQIDSFLSGFEQYVPRKLVRLFDEYELVSLCCLKIHYHQQQLSFINMVYNVYSIKAVTVYCLKNSYFVSVI